jgi:hypothetical protein
MTSTSKNMEAIVLQIAWWSRKKTYPAIYVPGI